MAFAGVPANSREGAREADFAVRRGKVPPIASTGIADAAFPGKSCERSGRHKSGSRQGRLAEFEADSPRNEPITSAIGAESPIAVSRSPTSTSSTSERATPSLSANSFPPPATCARHGPRPPPGSPPESFEETSGFGVSWSEWRNAKRTTHAGSLHLSRRGMPGIRTASPAGRRKRDVILVSPIRTVLLVGFRFFRTGEVPFEGVSVGCLLAQ